MEWCAETLFLWEYLKTASKPIVIYGMGDGCEKIHRACSDFGIPVAGIFASDEYVRGHSFLGYPVLRYEEAKKRFGGMIVLLGFAAYEKSLIEKIKRIASENELYAPDVPLFGEGLFDRTYLNEHADALSRVYSLLADEQSKKVFRSVVNYKISGKIGYLSECETSKREAYDTILRLGADECYCDLGAYDGDTALEFHRVVNGEYRHIYAFEPNPKNAVRFYKNCAKIENVTFIQKCAWNKEALLCFNAKAGRSSAIDNRGKVLIPAVAVDDVVSRPLTYIKLDVEGAEREALMGCDKQIRNHKPKLCVSAYHRNEDLFAIPLQVLAMQNDYRVYLRHEPYLPAWDTLYYFV